MTPTGKPAQHGSGVRKIEGFSQQLSVKFDNRITAENEVSRTHPGNGARFFTSKVFGLFKRRPSHDRMLRELGCADIKRKTEQGKKLFAPRGAGGQY
jgi:hypothetical protein